MELRARIETALGGALPELPPNTFDALETLEALLSKWEQAVDLTGFKTTDERDRRYFAEALAALPWVPSTGRAIDIGSGGGSPSLPLAAARPALGWTLVESNERKRVFLDVAAREMGLENVAVLAARYESVSPEAPCDAISVRGVAVTASMLDKIAEDLGSGGRLLWFSSASRLAEAQDRLGASFTCLNGPTTLIPDGGSLLVAERA